jgi:hypothetical protein
LQAGGLSAEKKISVSADRMSPELNDITSCLMSTSMCLGQMASTFVDVEMKVIGLCRVNMAKRSQMEFRMAVVRRKWDPLDHMRRSVTWQMVKRYFDNLPPRWSPNPSNGHTALASRGITQTVFYADQLATDNEAQPPADNESTPATT